MLVEASKRRAYDTDLTDEHWALLAPLLPPEVGVAGGIAVWICGKC